MVNFNDFVLELVYFFVEFCFLMFFLFSLFYINTIIIGLVFIFAR